MGPFLDVLIPGLSSDINCKTVSSFTLLSLSFSFSPAVRKDKGTKGEEDQKPFCCQRGEGGGRNGQRMNWSCQKVLMDSSKKKRYFFYLECFIWPHFFQGVMQELLRIIFQLFFCLQQLSDPFLSISNK